MPIIIGLIYAALEDMGYRPMWNKSETGVIFNFMMERAVCRMDQDTLVVTFVVPNIYPVIDDGYDEIIHNVNAFRL